MQFPDHLDDANCKKKLRMSHAIFKPNGTGMSKFEFQFNGDQAGPFKFVRLKKDNGLTTEVRFSIDTSDADVMAKVEARRNGYAGADGALKVTYSGIVEVNTEEEAEDEDQMSLDEALDQGNVQAAAEAVDARKRAKRSRKE